MSCRRSSAPNVFLDPHVTFKYFFVRKVMPVKYSSAFVREFPIVLLGRFALTHGPHAARRWYLGE